MRLRASFPMTDSNSPPKPQRIVFFGSGSFGLPTLQQLVEQHTVELVVSQPDRPAGRKRMMTSTPIAAFAEQHGLDTFKPDAPNRPDAIQRIHAVNADAFVVIAYGHKLSPDLLGEHFAMNLHASLLPKFRGAAPINWAMIQNEPETGVSVISLAQRMDAGAILAQVSTPIDPRETAGELHDRLAELGVEPMLQTLHAVQHNELQPVQQDEALASRAPKLAKADGTVSFDQPAAAVRARIHGLTPWPGCTVQLGEQRVKLLRVADRHDTSHTGAVGSVHEDGAIVCSDGVVEILELQPPGSKPMTWHDYARGHRLPANSHCEPV